jgi:hypothetical protein
MVADVPRVRQTWGSSGARGGASLADVHPHLAHRRRTLPLLATLVTLTVAAPAAGSVAISPQGDAIVLRGTDATSFVAANGANGGEARFESEIQAFGDPQAEPLEAGPGCASHTDFLYPAGPGVPAPPYRTRVTCPTAGIARIDIDLGGGANTLTRMAAGSPASAQPLAQSVLYHGGPGVDQLTEGPVASNAANVIEGGDGNDLLSGGNGHYLGGPGNDTINVRGQAQDGLAEPLVVDGGDGNDRITAMPKLVGHVIGGPGNDFVSGYVAEGNEGDDTVAGIVADAGPGDDTVGLETGLKSLRCGTGDDRWWGGAAYGPDSGARSAPPRDAVISRDCPPYLETRLQRLGAMHFDRRNRLIVPLRFSQAVRLSAAFVNFARSGHAFVHRVRMRLPEKGRVLRLRIKPKALAAMRSRGRRAYVAIHITARDAEGERFRARGNRALEGWALRRRSR